MTFKIVKLIRNLSYRYSVSQVFTDFLEIAAVIISNRVDKLQYKKREDRYFNIIKKYEKKDLNIFAEMLATLVLALDQKQEDILGQVFHELELHNEWKGQFFTPNHVCLMMVELLMKKYIKKSEYITLNEPCVGSGAMVIAFANLMKRQGFNYQKELFVLARDIDLKCVYMSYIQLSLLYIPAVIIYGDTLSLQEWDYWYTPSYILDGWGLKKEVLK